MAPGAFDQGTPSPRFSPGLGLAAAGTMDGDGDGDGAGSLLPEQQLLPEQGRLITSLYWLSYQKPYVSRLSTDRKTDHQIQMFNID